MKNYNITTKVTSVGISASATVSTKVGMIKVKRTYGFITQDKLKARFSTYCDFKVNQLAQARTF